jgi:hypothetical protein
MSLLDVKCGWYQATLSPFTLPFLSTVVWKLSETGITRSRVKPHHFPSVIFLEDVLGLPAQIWYASSLDVIFDKPED